MLLYIIRHGDPIYDPDSLTEKGHLQAKALSKRLAVHGLDKIYASPLKRAQQTAQPTCDLLGIPFKIEEWTSESTAYNEMSVDHDNGHHGWIFHQHPANLKNHNTKYLVDDWHTADCFKAHKNDFKSAYARICNASDEFLERHGYKREGSVYKIINPNDEKVAVFCHQGFGLTWISHLLGIPPHIFWTAFDISHSGVTVIEFKNFKNGTTLPMCLQLSDLSHIFADGELPFEYNNSIKL